MAQLGIAVDCIIATAGRTWEFDTCECAHVHVDMWCVSNSLGQTDRLVV